MLRIKSALLATGPSSVSAAVLAVSAEMCTRGEIIASPEVQRDVPQLCGCGRGDHRQPSGNEFCLQSCRCWRSPAEAFGVAARGLSGEVRGVGSDGEAEGSGRGESRRCTEGGEEDTQMPKEKKMSA